MKTVSWRPCPAIHVEIVDVEPLLQESLLFQIVFCDHPGRLPLNCNPTVEQLQCFKVKTLENRFQDSRNFRTLLKHFRADDWGGSIDRLDVLRVGEDLQAQCSKLAISTICHGCIDLLFAGGCCLLCEGGIATSEYQELFLTEGESISTLECGKGCLTGNKLLARSELEMTSCIHIGGQIVECLQGFLLSKIPTHGDCPGIVCRGRGEPYDVVCLQIKFCSLFISSLEILPKICLTLTWEKVVCISGILRIYINFASRNG